MCLFILSAPFWGVGSPGCFVAWLWYETFWTIETVLLTRTMGTWGAYSPHLVQQAMMNEFLFLSFPLSQSQALNFLEGINCKRRKSCPPSWGDSCVYLASGIVLARWTYCCQLIQKQRLQVALLAAPQNREQFACMSNTSENLAHGRLVRENHSTLQTFTLVLKC